MAIEHAKMGSLSKEQPLDDLGNHIYFEKQDENCSTIWETIFISRSRTRCATLALTFIRRR